MWGGGCGGMVQILNIHLLKFFGFRSGCYEVKGDYQLICPNEDLLS